MKNLIKRSLFVVTISAMILSFFINHAIINIVFALTALIYFALGWRIINPGGSNKFDPVYFLVGYFISTALMGFLLTAREYPLDTIFMKVGTGELLAGLLILLIFKKNRKYWFEPEINITLFLIVTALKLFC